MKLFRFNWGSLWIFLLHISAASGKNYSVSEIGGGFNWVENLAFQAESLFATNLREGKILRFDIEEDRTSKQPGLSYNYNSTVWVSGLGRVLGLTPDPRDEDVLYSVGEYSNQYVIFSFSASRRENFTVLATTPKCGNGLGLHWKTRQLYTASEGDFLPGNGALYSFSLSSKTHRRKGTPSARVISNDLFAADGLWIDQERDVLYVGQLFDGDVLAWNISDAGKPKSLGRVPGASLSTGSFLDDFTLSKSGARIIGCDWSGSKIVEMPAWPGETFLEGRGLDGTSVLVDTVIKHPTSARFGSVKWGQNSLYVSEGDSLLKSSKKDKIWRIDFH